MNKPRGAGVPQATPTAVMSSPAGGGVYALHMLANKSPDDDGLAVLSKIAKRLTKKKGGLDVA